MKTSKKLLSVLLALVMVVSMLGMSALATDPTSLTGFGQSVGSITITGVDVSSWNYTTSETLNGTAYDYYMELSSSTSAGATATATFTKAADASADCVIAKTDNVPNPPLGIVVLHANESLVYDATLSDGTGSAVAYVNHDVVKAFADYDTYRFHYFLPYPVSIDTGAPVFIAWDGNNGTVTGRNGSTVIPASFILWVEGTNSITVNGSTQTSSNFDDTDPNHVNYAFTINTSTSAATTISVTAGGQTYTITCPVQKLAAAGGTSPTALLSYLPIGQYANRQFGTAGTIYDGPRTSLSDPVSLGALGGYMDFYFKDGIIDDPRNPYGVDFVIYGNAFNGNPEPGAVQVSEDGVTWYELAGSRYYSDGFDIDTNKATGGKYSNVYTGTLRDTSVTYTKGAGDIKATLDGHTATFVNGTSWWPLANKYPEKGAHLNAGSNVQVDFGTNKLTFTGITAIQDSNDTAFYAFGYADVTPNGAPDAYGDAVNPYTPYTSSKEGGDGFDLAWAVDIATGEPVGTMNADGSYRNFKYVRVYSAVLDNGTFGETSCEVCGIFTTANKAAASVGTTAAPTITINGETIDLTDEYAEAVSDNVVLYNYDLESGMSITAGGATGSYVYINGTQTTGFTTTSNAEAVQVIVQSGTAEPFIVVIK